MLEFTIRDRLSDLGIPRFSCGNGMPTLRLLEFSIILRLMDSKMQHLTVITTPTTFGGKVHCLMEKSSTVLTAFTIAAIIILVV